MPGSKLRRNVYLVKLNWTFLVRVAVVKKHQFNHKFILKNKMLIFIIALYLIDMKYVRAENIFT